MTETKFAGLLAIDSGGTLDRMKREDIEKILALAAAAHCKVIIATGATFFEDRTADYLTKIDLPKEWPPIHTSVTKNELGTYKELADEHEIPIDRIILIDDAFYNIACAATAGVHALKYNSFPAPFVCQYFIGVRDEKRDFSAWGFKYVKEEFSDKVDFFGALEHALAKLAPNLPMTETPNKEWLLIFDFDGTLNCIAPQEKETLLSPSMAPFKYIIASGSDKAKVDAYLSAIRIPSDRFLAIHGFADKSRESFYKDIANEYRIPLTQIIVINDDKPEIKVATKTGVHGLYFRKHFDLGEGGTVSSYFACQYYDGSTGTFGEKAPLLRAIEQIVSGPQPKPPQAVPAGTPTDPRPQVR